MRRWLPVRTPGPTIGYCRRDNRVYAQCPLGDNYESCTIGADCMLCAQLRTACTGEDAPVVPPLPGRDDQQAAAEPSPGPAPPVPSR